MLWIHPCTLWCRLHTAQVLQNTGKLSPAYLHNKLKSIGDAQYVITLNEDEIILLNDEQEEIASLSFNLKGRAIIKLEDTPEKMFFGREFG